jgi:hypothetical protein
MVSTKKHVDKEKTDQSHALSTENWLVNILAMLKLAIKMTNRLYGSHHNLLTMEFTKKVAEKE